jgi:ABC-2 type transport system permease protein
VSTERGLRRFWSLTLTLAVTEFKLRYYGNALGYFWTLVKPLLLFGVLYVAFTEILKVGDAVPHYPEMLILGIVLYNYFGEATGQAVPSLVAHENLIRKVPMPLLAIPLSVALRAFFTLCLDLIAVGVFFALSGVEVTSYWLEFPLLIATLLVFTTGVAALLANLYVPFRDVAPIWEIVTQLMFWGSPIVYPIESVPNGALKSLILMNPLAVVITQARHSLIDPSAPSAADAAGGDAALLIPAAIVLATLALSFWLHRRITPRIAESV